MGKEWPESVLTTIHPPNRFLDKLATAGAQAELVWYTWHRDAYNMGKETLEEHEPMERWCKYLTEESCGLTIPIEAGEFETEEAEPLDATEIRRFRGIAARL